MDRSTYTPCANFFGERPVHFRATDSLRETPNLANVCRSRIDPVNDVPTFTKGLDQDRSNEDSGHRNTVIGWATQPQQGPCERFTGLVVAYFIVFEHTTTPLFATPAR
jgi:hypothetical protein